MLKHGVGRLYADDTENGTPVRIGFIWSNVTATSCRWEQSYSPDGGERRETNWVQDLKRARWFCMPRSIVTSALDTMRRQKGSQQSAVSPSR